MFDVNHTEIIKKQRHEIEALKDNLARLIMEHNKASNLSYEEENRIMKETIQQLSHELDRFKQVPHMVCEFIDYLDDGVVIKAPNSNMFNVGISKDCEKLTPQDMVLCEQKNLTVIKKIPKKFAFSKQ